MPIIYVHGVNTRDPNHFEPVKEYLRRIVAPAISNDPETVSIVAADWFQFCDPPKWGGISRPRTALLGHGAAEDEVVRDDVVESIIKQVTKEDASSGDPFTSGQQTSTTTVRLADLDDAQLSDLVALALAPKAKSPIEAARIGVAADAVVRDKAVRAELVDAVGLEAQLKVLADAVEKKVDEESEFAGHGAVGDFFRGIKDRVNEGISRLASEPAVAVSVVVGELRPGLNDLVTRFLGDVLCYVTRRGARDKPGDIPSVLIDALVAAQAEKNKRGGEPIVVLTHSMGGQVAYDVVSAFLPVLHKDITVDFWCATASQVGFFEEMNLFLASSKDYSRTTGKATPLSRANLGHWWNVWDLNDILSFTTEGIFADGIDDGEFATGMSLLTAHGGYLQRPSFYRELADRLEKAFPDRRA